MAQEVAGSKPVTRPTKVPPAQSVLIGRRPRRFDAPIAGPHGELTSVPRVVGAGVTRSTGQELSIFPTAGSLMYSVVCARIAGRRCHRLVPSQLVIKML